MKKTVIKLESYYGGTTENVLIEQQSDKLMIVLPGQGYTIDRSLMHYSGKIGLEFGFDVLNIEYGFQITHREFKFETEFNILLDEVLQVIKQVVDKKYKKIIFVGKSLGTVVQSHIAEKLENYDQLHVFLTPVDGTFEKEVKSPCLVITGTADKRLSSSKLSYIEESGKFEIVKISEGKHSLECADTLKSIEILQLSMKALKDFISKYNS